MGDHRSRRSTAERRRAGAGNDALDASRGPDRDGASSFDSAAAAWALLAKPDGNDAAIGRKIAPHERQRALLALQRTIGNAGTGWVVSQANRRGHRHAAQAGIIQRDEDDEGGGESFDFGDGLADIVSDAVESATESASGVLDAGSEALGEFAEGAAEAVTEGAGAVESAAGELAEGAGELAEGAAAEASSLLDGGGITGESGGLIVDDDADASPTQMRKGDFVGVVRAAVEASVTALLGEDQSGATAAEIDRQFGRHAALPAAELEREIQTQVPSAASVPAAQLYVPLIVAQVAAGIEAGNEGDGSAEAESASAPAGDDSLAGMGSVLRKARMETGNIPTDPRAVIARLGAGRPLDAAVRSGVGGALGQDLSGVRVHADGAGGRMADALNARAFAVGNHVGFAPGEYRPGTPVGDALIAHELAHVIQQGGSPASLGRSSASTDDATLEADADRVAVAAAGSLWGRGVAGLSRFAANVVPAARSGLRMSLRSCGSRKDEPPKVSIATVNRPLGGVRGIDRIPPNVDTEVEVSVDNADPANPVTLAAEAGDAGAAAGSVTINGSPQHQLTSTEKVKVRGGTQTAPGSKDSLRLVATVAGVQVAQSNTFSVAAYPIAVEMGFAGLVEGTSVAQFAKAWGAQYNLTIRSDSGSAADLDEVLVSEVVIPLQQTGIFSGLEGFGSKFLPANQSQTDTHAMSSKSADAGSAGRLKGVIDKVPNSSAEQEQRLIFKDQRTGNQPVTVLKSGFGIKLVTVIDSPEGGGAKRHFIVVTKSPKSNGQADPGIVDATPHRAEVK
ncbi:MAG: hypothetical protein QOJ59_1684 [Thermomicrobiales bacterium]|jgi:hypothetical protein|nr:hypothetical protein [Thermomicrobiales bacterium]